jgi:hypothetical protein
MSKDIFEFSTKIYCKSVGFQYNVWKIFFLSKFLGLDTSAESMTFRVLLLIKGNIFLDNVGFMSTQNFTYISKI